MSQVRLELWDVWAPTRAASPPAERGSIALVGRVHLLGATCTHHVREYLRAIGRPITLMDLSKAVRLPPKDVGAALVRMERRGEVRSSERQDCGAARRGQVPKGGHPKAYWWVGHKAVQG